LRALNIHQYAPANPMDPLEVVILALVQGVTEFLPISSSGHLAVVGALFEQLGRPLDKKLTLTVVLHLGTLAAILVFYWRRVRRLVDQDRRMVGLLAVGTLPAAVVGLPLKWLVGDLLQNAELVGFMFLLTGAMLLWSDRAKPGNLICRELSYARALLIGAFQALAILPGVSRSGATIVAGLGCGLKRDEAAVFSFLLAIPVIAGAGLIELLDLARGSPDSAPSGLLALGAGLSFAVGLASLAFLVRWLRQGRLRHFAWWVLLLGPTVLAWRLLLS
jgi:undecaprenyl-diphosphatase